MKVLVACEFSGVVRRAFRARGHDAWSCDLLPAEDASEYHIQGDVLEVLGDGWDMMIFHAPCTRLCNSGVRWLEERGLWDDMKAGAIFFKTLLNYEKIPKRVGENPIPHHYAVDEIGCKYDQIIHPWQHGHGEKKATCLWVRGLPLLQPTNIVAGRLARCHGESPGDDRWKRRSRTYPGIAEAMAEQWGGAA